MPCLHPLRRRDGGLPRRRLSHTNVAATLALFLAIGGTWTVTG